jgi:tetratricopeptide (TPR) repeat protein
MLGVCVYLQYLRTRSLALYLLTLVLALLSMLAKAMAFSFPIVLLVMDWMAGRKFTGKTFLEKIPYFLFIIPIAWVTFLKQEPAAADNAMEAIILWIWSFSFYIQKFFLPWKLTPVYELPTPIGLTQFAYIMAFVVLAACIALFIRYRRNRFFVFAFLYYLASIFIVLRLGDVAHHSVVADRFMYLPSLGFCVFLGVFFDQGINLLGKRFRWAGGACLLAVLSLFAVLGIMTHAQCKVWKNSDTLWGRVIQNSPGVNVAYNNRGLYYHEKGLDSEALAFYRKAVEVDENYGDPHNNMGAVYHKQGRKKLALAHFKKAVELDPDHIDATYNVGTLYFEAGRLALALDYYDKVLALDPMHEKSHHNKSCILLNQGKYEECIVHSNRALEINPNNAAMYFNRAIAKVRLGRTREGLADAITAKEKGAAVPDSFFAEIEEKLKQ